MHALSMRLFLTPMLGECGSTEYYPNIMNSTSEVFEKSSKSYLTEIVKLDYDDILIL